MPRGGLGRPRRRPAQGEDHLPGPRVGGLSQPLRLVPQPRQAEGGPEPRQLRLGDARRRLRQGDRAGRCREQHALPGGLAQGRAQDAAQLAQDPRRRDRADPQVDRGGRARELRQRADGQGQAEVRVQARPRGPGQAGRHAGDAREPHDRAVRPPGQAERGRGDGRRVPGPPWSRSPATSRCCSIERPITTWSACCRFPRGRSTSSNSAATATCSWPAAAGAVSRGSRSPGTSRREPGSSRSARNTTWSWRPTSAPTTARSSLGGPEQGRADLQHGRRIAGAGDAQAHRVDHGRRVQPRRRACSPPATATTV